MAPENLPFIGKNFAMFKRHIARCLMEAFIDTPVVFLRGARQSGKSALAMELSRSGFNAGYFTVDVVLEDRSGNMVGLEIKLTASPTAASFSGLNALQGLAGKRSRAGILLYTGKGMVPFGKKLAAIPASALWKRQA
jgi:hypothetical protein